MVTIVRGYTFGPTEEVNAAKLHQLIDATVISDFGPDNFDGAVHGIRLGFPSASPTAGDMWFLHNDFAGSFFEWPDTGRSVWSEPQFLIQLDEREVNCFKLHGLETGRIVQGTDIATMAPGGPVLLEGSDSGATVLSAEDNTTNPKNFTVGAAYVETVPSGKALRTTIIGPCAIESTAAGIGTWPNLVYDGNTQSWVSSAATTLDNGFGLFLSNALSGTRRHLGYLFGGLIYRN